MAALMRSFNVSGVIGEHRHMEYGIKASTVKQAKYLFSAPISRGGRGNGFRVFDMTVRENPSRQMSLF